jgi:hypothetical protein
MKKNIFILLFVLGSDLLQAQEVLRVQNGGILSLVNGATITIAGGVTLADGSQLINNGTITLNQNGSAGAADWTDNTLTAYNYGIGTFIFSSSANQSINSKNIFERIDVNTAGLDITSDISSNNWYLINGIVNTNAFKAIALSTSQTAIQADPANPGYSRSWINGQIRRYIAPASVDSYDFPVGGATQSNQVTLNNLNAAPLTGTAYLDLDFGAKPGTDAGLIVTENGIPYTAVNDGGIWHITPNTEPTGGKYDLLLYFTGFTGLDDNKFAPLERPDASSDAADWVVPPGSSLPSEGNPGRTVASGFAERNNLSAFSQFGIGMTITPLPVTLIGFDARRLSKVLVALDWETTMEENNKGFGVERRLDKETAFSSAGFVASEAPGGNSSLTLTYHFTDTNSYTGISYYRLKQEDLDDHFVYTLIKAVSGSGETQMSVLLYPNPGHGQFTLRVDGTDKPFVAVITDVSGRIIRTVNAYGNNNVSVSGLKPGLYIIEIPDVFGKGKSFTEKVLIIP